METSDNLPERPRVVLLTAPTLFGAQIINRLADHDGVELVGVALSVQPFQKKSLLPAIAAFLKRTGWRYLLANGLEADVSWTWLRLTGRPAGLKPLAKNARPLWDVNAADSLEWMRGLRPDFVVSYYFNQWIGPDLCSVPRRACVNVHPSLLPALRGPDPVFRALERGLPATGITIHEVARKIDAGRILHQESREIPPGLTKFGLYQRLIRDGAQLVADWMAGRVVPQTHEQAPPGAGDYATFPAPHEVRSFVRAGQRLVGLSEWRKALSEVR